MRDAIATADAVLIATSEYNGFPTPLLINAFDWLSRLKDGLAVAADKPVALVSSSSGALGGLRGMNFLRQYLQMAFQMPEVPPQHPNRARPCGITSARSLAFGASTPCACAECCPTACVRVSPMRGSDAMRLRYRRCRGACLRSEAAQ
jgi:hypothetical protein